MRREKTFAWDVLELVPSTLLGLPISISSPAATSVVPEPPSGAFQQGQFLLSSVSTTRTGCRELAAPAGMHYLTDGCPAQSTGLSMSCSRSCAVLHDLSTDCSAAGGQPLGSPPLYLGAAPSGGGSAHSQQADSTVLWKRDEATASSRQPEKPPSGSTVLWIKSDVEPADRANTGVQREVGPPDSTVLWRREEPAAPSSLSFPDHNAARNGPGELVWQGQGMQGKSRGERPQNGLSQPSSSEEDPWRAPAQPAAAAATPDASAEEWIQMHAGLQPRGEDPWRHTSTIPTPAQSALRSATGDYTPVRRSANGNGGRYSGMASGKDGGRQGEKGRARVRDRSVLYNNVEQVPRGSRLRK